MEQITITAKIQISAADNDKVLLDTTMSVYSDACTYVSCINGGCISYFQCPDLN